MFWPNFKNIQKVFSALSLSLSLVIFYFPSLLDEGVVTVRWISIAVRF